MPVDFNLIDPLLASHGSGRWGGGQSLGQPVQLTYRFLDSLPVHYAGRSESYGFLPLNAAQRDATLTAIASWAGVANISFQPASGASATLDIGTYYQPGPALAHAYYPSSHPLGGDIWLDRANWSDARMKPGGWDYLGLIHEIGHALGLKHPGNYNAGGGGTDGPYLPGSLDSHRFAVMSYSTHPQMSGVEPATPMLFDIAAMQYMYGANMTTHAGADVYNASYFFGGGGAARDFVTSIWDAGGNDTLDVSGFATASVVDLQGWDGQGNNYHFSSVGTYHGTRATNNLAIAYGVTIENALGGNGNDTLTGNAASNTLDGGAGNDILTGLGGNDTLRGGAGADTYVFQANWGRDVIDDNTAGDSLRFDNAGLIAATRQGRDLTLGQGSNSVFIRNFYNSADGSDHLAWSLRTEQGDIALPTTQSGGGGDPNDPGATRDTARTIGALDSVNASANPNVGIAGRLGDITGGVRDADDYYQFDVRERSQVSLRLTPTPGAQNFNGDLELQNASGGIVGQSRKGVGLEDSLATTLDAGTYYAHVIGAGGSGAYTFSATAESTGGRADTTDNTPAGAIDLSPLRPQAHIAENWVGRGDARDFYQFTLAATASVDLALSGLSGDANLTLYNAQNIVLGSAAHVGSIDETISRNLGQGTYYVLVSQGTAGSETHYRLSAAATTISFDGAGNDRGSALDLGILDSREKTINDWVSTRLDASDFYHFSLAATSTFNLRLDSLRANADVQLLNSVGQVLVAGMQLGTAAETITKALTAGDYYVRVLPAAGGETDYRLRLSASTISVDGAGNTTSSAFDIGLLDTRDRVFNDWVSSALDANDYYHFRLAGTAGVQLGLSGLSADADVRIIDSRGIVMASGLRAGTTSENLSSTLAAGDYWVRVSPGLAGVETSYRLALHADTVTRDNAGNTRAQALNIGTLDERSREFSDWVSGRLDANDWYQFTLTGVSQVNLKLSSTEVNADLQLVNALGTVLASSASHGMGADEVIQRSLAQGTYYVRVTPADAAGSGNYQLAMSAPLGGIVDNAPNTRAQSRDIGILDSRVQGFDDWVSGTLDSNDWYRFSVAQSSQVSLRLDGLADNANIQLYDALGSLLGTSFQPGTAAESLERVLGTGSYHVRVYPGAAAVATNYHLTLQATSSLLYFPEVLGTAADDSLYAVSGSVTYSGPGNDWLFGASGFGSQRMVGGKGNDTYVAAANGAITVLDRGSSTGDSLIASAITLGSSTARAQIIDNRHLMLWDTVSKEYVYLNDWLAPENRIEDFYFNNFQQVLDFDHFYQRVMAMRPLPLSWSASGAITGLPAPFNTAAGINSLIDHMGSRAIEVEQLLTATNAGDVGNTAATASDLGTLASTVTRSGSVSDLDLHDYYRFTLGAATSGQIRLDVTGGDADITLYAANGTTKLAYSNNAGTQSDLITGVLDAGQYYIAVDQYSQFPSYTLSITPTALQPLAPDNTPAQAHDMGNLSDPAGTGSARFADRVDSRDTQDYFKFTLSAAAQVELALTGMSADADMYLYGSNGVTRIDYANNAGSRDEQLQEILGAGTYYVAVKSYAGNGTDYQLAIQARGAGSNDAGNTLATARDLGNLLDPARNGVTAANDRVSPVDEDDYFKFSLSGPSRVNLSLTGLSGGDADLTLLKSDGALVDIASMSLNLDTANESLSRVLDTGTYYVWVSQFDGTTPYSLSLVALGAATDAAGNTLATAAEVGDMLNAPYVFNDRVDAIDRNDFYHFVLAAETNISLQLDSLAADADLRLLTADGSEIVLSHNRGLTEEKLNRTLAAGSYFVHVTPFGGAETNYRLIVNTGLDPNDFVAGQQALQADQANRAPYDRIFRSWGSDDTTVFAAQASTADLFRVADNSLMNIGLNTDGVRDAVAANGIGFGRSSSHFAEIDGRNLLAWDTQSHQAFYIADWRADGEKLGHFDLSDGSMTFQQFARMLAASPAFVSGVSAGDVDLSRGIDDWLGGRALSPAQLAGGKHPLAGTIGSDTLSGQAGDDFIYGQAGNDILAGNAGNDVLVGGKGRDILTGGAGKDAFVFDTAPTSGFDTITDFRSGEDRIELDRAIFDKLGAAGTLGAEFFVEGTAALDGNDFLVYDRTTGILWYDADGSGDGAALQIAFLSNKATVAASDFAVL